MLDRPERGLVACLATGPSLPGLLAELPDDVPCIAVNDAWRLRSAPIAAQDSAWWYANPDAMEAPVEKFSASRVAGVTHVSGVYSGINSGLFALFVARRLGYTTALLLGYDMHGSHYFGPHATLKNTTPERYTAFLRQFDIYRVPEVETINCTPGSALKRFPYMPVKEAVCEFERFGTFTPAAAGISAKDRSSRSTARRERHG